jgi:hypothetical protein
MRRDAINHKSGDMGLMPVAGELIAVPTAGKEDQRKMYQEFAAADALDAQIDDVEASFMAVRQKVQSGEIASVGPWIPEKWQDVLRFAGAQDPDVAQLKVRSFLTISFVLKAIQGSRPSDFDFKNFLAVMPQLQEILSESGPARLSALRKLIRNNQLGRFSPGVRARTMQMKAEMKKRSKHKGEDAVLDAEYQKYLGVALDEEATVEEKRAALVDLLQAGEKWRATGAADNWVPPAAADAIRPSLTPNETQLLDGI